MPDTRLILHIKGTENQTAEIPKAIVRAGIAQGQISRSQLIWSAADNAWKQVRELPELLPSQQIAPAPAPRVGTASLPQAAQVQPAQVQPAQAQPVQVQPTQARPVHTGSVPRVAAKASVRSAPPGFKAATAKSAVRPANKPAIKPESTKSAVRPEGHAAPEESMVVREKGGFGFMKWICVGLGLLILGAVGVNYLMVDRPLASSLGQTPFANVPVYAHLGAFVQPGALVIHVPPTSALTSANLAEFLRTLAHSTPDAPTGGGPFDNVSLTTGWTGHYSFTGYAWKEFGDMADKDDEEKESFLLDQLKDPSGQPLVSPNGTLDPTAQQAERDRVWTDFVTYFTK